MSPEWIEPAAAALASLTALLMLPVRNPRLNITLLGLQYLALFALISRLWPLPQAAAILFAGWMAAAVLGMATLSTPGSNPPERNKESAERADPGLWLDLSAAGLVLLLAIAAAGIPQAWIPGLETWTSAAALILAGLSLLRLALYPDAGATATALLTLLGGFSLLFAHLSASQVASGLLAGTTLLLALAGAYLMVASAMEKAA